MPPEELLDLAELDFSRPAADRAAVYAILPHRHEMQLIDAVVLVDPARELVAGYKDVTGNEFWVRGHFPQAALFPGVLQIEAAAQLTGYYLGAVYSGQFGFIALGGVENCRFRSPVRLGDRLVLVGKAMKIHRRQMAFAMQGFVAGAMVFHADVYGMPMKLPGG
jgi:3-hydroxyacyl-[acyl-carrier-protein] dehydratase